MINMLKALRDELDNMKEQMGNVSKEIEILRIKMLKIKKKTYCSGKEDGL